MIMPANQDPSTAVAVYIFKPTAKQNVLVNQSSRKLISLECLRKCINVFLTSGESWSAIWAIALSCKWLPPWQVLRYAFAEDLIALAWGCLTSNLRGPELPPDKMLDLGMRFVLAVISLTWFLRFDVFPDSRNSHVGVLITWFSVKVGVHLVIYLMKCQMNNDRNANIRN